MKFLIPLSLIFVLYGCPIFEKFENDSIQIYNRTDNAIYIYLSNKKTLKKSEPISLFIKKGNKIRSPHYRINAYCNYGLSIRFLLNKKKKHEKIYLFVIKENTLQKFSWEEICVKKMHATRKEITINHTVYKRLIYHYNEK